MRNLVVAALLILMTCGVAVAKKRLGEVAYISAGPDGVLYARCVPTIGEKGPHTDVYQVEGETDKLINRYDWFTQRGVVLGWSPIKGEVGLMAVRVEANPQPTDWRKRELLRFCLGGRIIKTYTNADFIALGAVEQIEKEEGGHSATIRVIGCEQVPGTNAYDFIVEIGEGKRLRFDIITGEQRVVVSPSARGKERAATDLAAGRAKILYYGKPWSNGKPLVDDACGLPVEIIAGCAVTEDFVQETNAYNDAVRAWAAQSAKRGSQ